jgi:hypothetical protein
VCSSDLALSPLAGRHFDFALCEKKNLTVACVIQLYDKSNPARQAESLKSVCDAVGLPFARFQIRAEYPIAAMRETLLEAMAEEPFYLAETGGRREPHISSIEGVKF